MKLPCVVAALLLVSCGGDDDCCKVVPDADIGIPNGLVEVARVPVNANRDVDMLFVVDDSPSMLDKQLNLKNAFPAFISELSLLDGGLPNVHIGVITPDLGTKGADDTTPGPAIGSGAGRCAGTGKAGALRTSSLVQGAYIEDIKDDSGTRVTNYTGTLASAFSDIASAGGNGCGFEQPLQAAKVAIADTAENAGFLRPAASLAIIMVTDEDDCSIAHSSLFAPDTIALGPLQSFRCTRFGVTCDVGGASTDAMNVFGMKEQCHSNESSPYLTRVADYVTFFKGLKPDPTQVLFAALIGDPATVTVEARVPPSGGAAINTLAHTCTYEGASGPEVADPGVRLAEVARHFSRRTVASICAQDISAPLADVARQVRGLAGDPCLTRAIALPPECIVREEVGTSSTQLPACDNGASSTNKPCYELVENLTSCTAGSHLAVRVEREAAPAANAVVVASCKI